MIIIIDNNFHNVISNKFQKIIKIYHHYINIIELQILYYLIFLY
jgi:hypothetical protein